MKEKILVILPRIPVPDDNKSDKRLVDLLCAITGKYEVHILFSQTVLEKEDARANIEKLGIKLIYTKEPTDKKLVSMQARLKGLLDTERYKIILFDSYYSAKYYIPYLELKDSESVIAINIERSPYLYKSTLKKAMAGNLSRRTEPSRYKEVGVYAHADVIITKSDEAAQGLSKDIPEVAVMVIPETTQKDDLEKTACKVFDEMRKKKVVSVKDIKTDINIIKVLKNKDSENSLVDKYNDALKHIASEYGFIAFDSIVYSQEALEAMLFCAVSNSDIGVVVPCSNFDIDRSVIHGNLSEFIPKHYMANFGNWDEMKQIAPHCMLIRKELVDAIGYLDTKYQSLHYALFDFSLKALQAGYKILAANEAFVSAKKIKMNEEDLFAGDYDLFMNKWCDQSAEFIENIS